MSWKTFVILAQAIVARASFHDDLARRQVVFPPACSSWSSAISFCKAQTSGFVSLPSDLQAPCLCYSHSTWYPQTFDGWVDSCASWASTADPTDYTIVDGWASLCTTAGDVLGHSTVVAASTTAASASASHVITSAPSVTAAASTNIYANAGCSFLSFALSFCESASPGFTDMPVSSQAPCLCYSINVWSPNLFDGPVSTCADYVKSAAPSLYVTISSLEGFCSSAGDVTKTTAPATTATTKQTAVVVVVTQTSSAAKASKGAAIGGREVAGWVSVYVVVELVVAVIL